MIVAEVNVVAYLLIAGERSGRARELWRHDPDRRLPHLWRHGYLNAPATFGRHGGVDVADARMLWRCAAGPFEDATRETDVEEALGLAVRGDVGACDAAQYVVLARQHRTVCVMEGRRLPGAFPAVARTREQVCGP